MPDVTELLPGDPTKIAGYQVVGRLGTGGQGVVYLGVAGSGERVAIKQLRFGQQDDRARQQLVKEVAAARLVAPFCTAVVLDADLDGPSPYVVSEYIDGLSLQQRIEQRGPMTGATLQRLAIGTATALAAIHQVGVVHRDFKPANVMLASDGPRVIDFGIARDLSTETTVTSRIFGTPAYMAPEQLRAERVGPATDMFAWASVIAYAATGRAPFEAPHMVAVMHRISSAEPDLTGVPPALVGVLRRCLDKDPNARPTAQQALALLLGRPAPEHDAADATQVLAEATGLVHAAAIGVATTRGAASTPTLLDVPPTVQRVAPESPAVRPWGAGNVVIPGVPPAGVSELPAAGPASAGGSGSPSERSGPAAGGPGSPSGGSGSNRGRSFLAAAAVLVLVLGGGWGLAQSGLLGGASDGDPRTSQTTGPLVISPSEEDSNPLPTDEETTADPGTGGDNEDDGAIPEAFDGNWKGVGLQPNGQVKSWEVEIKLDQGETSGTMKLPDLKCSGYLTVTSAADDVLELDAVMDKDRDNQCADSAKVTLTLSDGSLDFAWVDASDASNTATGTLED